MIGQQKSQCKSEVRVTGIDPSLRGTGVCCLEHGVYTPTFLPELKLRGADRLLALRDRLFNVIDAFWPEMVVLEGYSYDSVGRIAELGEWTGIIKLGLRERDIPFDTVAPKRLKKFMGVKSDDKAFMIAAVKQRLGLDTGKNDNLADAAALARVAEVYLTNDSKYRSELEVVRSMGVVRLPEKRYKRLKGAL